jgi:hypothetical protein
MKRRTQNRPQRRLVFVLLVAGNTAAQAAGIAAGYERTPTLWQIACLTFAALAVTALGAVTLGPDALLVEAIGLLKKILKGGGKDLTRKSFAALVDEEILPI